MKGGHQMTQQSPPQIFHDKEEKPKSFVAYPTELFAKINSVCTYNEQKVLLTLLGCKGDGSFCPSTQYMLSMTGISRPNHYFAVRKQLIDKGYIEEKDGDLYISVDKILNATKDAKQVKTKSSEAGEP
jgi:hypothetical protein